MVETPLVAIEEISYALGDGTKSLAALATEAVQGVATKDIGGVIVATFSNPERFPALSVRIVSELGLPPATPAFDLQMACSAYPYAVYLAGRLSADIGRRILVVDGDVQSRLVDTNDHATGHIFSDAVTASVIHADRNAPEKSRFDFLSKADEALACPSEGPIRMDGMKVFTFVATEVRAFLKDFLSNLRGTCKTRTARALTGRLSREFPSIAAAESSGSTETRRFCKCLLQHPTTNIQHSTFNLQPLLFVPHQANPYMVRQLAKSLGLESELVALDEKLLNPGSCSVPLALATSGKQGLALIAGFGAGYSASAGLVKVGKTVPPAPSPAAA